MNETAVTVQHMSKSYDGKPAVTDLSFDIARGEIFALLGPNGAGKSTTIEILEGFRVRTGGQVQVLGEDPATGDRNWKARLGMVLQETATPDGVTVGQLVATYAAACPNPRPVAEVIDAVGLTDTARKLASKLSGGQRRRLDVALAIVGRPELIFLDEPTTGFDPQARRAFWELIRSLRDDGASVLLTTHYLDEAEQLSDRAGIIDGGHLVACGPIHQLGGRQAWRPQVRWLDNGRLRAETTDTPMSLVNNLYHQFGQLDDLEIIRPNLEDVYLNLITAKEAS